MKSLQEINKIAHIKNKKLYKIFFIVISSFLFIGIIIYNVFINTNELTHIEKVIKKHNAIRESLENPTHPTIRKPASSQIGIIGMDSVRVIN